MKMNQVDLNEEEDYNKKLTCQKNNKGDHLCCKRNCQHVAVVCASQNCECKVLHKKCLFLDLTSFKEQIVSKSISLKPLIQMLDSCIQKTIDKLSDFRDKILCILTQNVNYDGLSKEQNHFIVAINSGNPSQLTGKFVRNIFQKVQQPSKANQNLQKFSKQIQEEWNKINTQSQKVFNNISQLLQKLQINLLENKPQNQKFLNSAILKNNDQYVARIQNFFQTQKIKKTKLLYRASQNQFQVSKFHQKCDNIPNTIVLIQTQFGKLAGGYTPLIWFQPQHNQWVPDEQLKTFVFSLSQNQKFKLVSKSNSIHRYNNINYALQFGGSLWIYNKANTTTSSGFGINPSYYHNEKYPQQTKQLIQKLNGNTNNSNAVKLKQWQVWSLQLQKK